MANNNNTATFFAISTILLLLVSSFSVLPSVTTMAQQIPLTQEELDQQNRLQNEITATTKNLAQGQKEVNGELHIRQDGQTLCGWRLTPYPYSLLIVYPVNLQTLDKRYWVALNWKS
jgi:hypothetical protein